MAQFPPEPLRRRRVAAARTSGLPIDYLRRSNERRQQKREEMEIIIRAKQERIKVLQNAGLEYFSSDEEDTDKESDAEIFEYYDHSQDTDTGSKTVAPAEETDEEGVDVNMDEYNDLFSEKVVESPEMETPKEESPKMERKVETPKAESPKVESPQAQEQPPERIPRNTLRLSLYPAMDQRNGGIHALLKCARCVEHGQILLFSSEERLLAHIETSHDISFDG